MGLTIEIDHNTSFLPYIYSLDALPALLDLFDGSQNTCYFKDGEKVSQPWPLALALSPYPIQSFLLKDPPCSFSTLRLQPSSASLLTPEDWGEQVQLVGRSGTIGGASWHLIQNLQLLCWWCGTCQCPSTVAVALGIHYVRNCEPVIDVHQRSKQGNDLQTAYHKHLNQMHTKTQCHQITCQCNIWTQQRNHNHSHNTQTIYMFSSGNPAAFLSSLV